jgi:hypothetical protein
MAVLTTRYCRFGPSLLYGVRHVSVQFSIRIGFPIRRSSEAERVFRRKDHRERAEKGGMASLLRSNGRSDREQSFDDAHANDRHWVGRSRHCERLVNGNHLHSPPAGRQTAKGPKTDGCRGHPCPPVAH